MDFLLTALLVFFFVIFLLDLDVDFLFCFTKALGDDKAASVLARIMPSSSSKGLDILQWMDARSIGEMVADEHPQIIAIILSVLEYDIAADVLNFIDPEVRAEVVHRVAALETVHPNAMQKLEVIMQEQFSSSASVKSSSFGGISDQANSIDKAAIGLRYSE